MAWEVLREGFGAQRVRADLDQAIGVLLPAGLDWVTVDRSTWTHFPPMPPDPAFPAFVVTVFADITTRALAPDVLAIAREWRPDLIVREVMEWSRCLVGELLDIPHVSIGGNAYSRVDSSEIRYFRQPPLRR
jgi:hypothetical protein